MDAVGMCVKLIRDDGFVRPRQLGPPVSMLSKRVWIHGSKGSVQGLTGVRGGHGMHSREDRMKVPAEEDMYVDIGCSSREEALELGVRVGDPITNGGDLVTLRDPCCIAAPALDDRVGIGCLLTLAAGLKDIKKRPEVIIAGTVEGKTGSRGAGTVAFRMRPDLGIAVDGQRAAGTPDISSEQLPVEIGKGPVIKFCEGQSGPTNHPRVRDLLIQGAREANVNCQTVAFLGDETDIGSIEQSGPGVPVASIGVPCRYGGSPNVVMNLADIDGTTAVLMESIRILGQGYSLSRI